MAAAPVVHVAPVHMGVVRVIGAGGGMAQPLGPVEANGLRAIGELSAGRIQRRATRYGEFCIRGQRGQLLAQGHTRAGVGQGVTRLHYGTPAVGRLDEARGFARQPDAGGFEVHILAVLKGSQCEARVPVVGRGNHDAIDIAQRHEFLEGGQRPRPGAGARRGTFQLAQVHVEEGHGVEPRHGEQFCPALAQAHVASGEASAGVGPARGRVRQTGCGKHPRSNQKRAAAQSI